INIARGRCVVTEDLIAALRSGQLAGAGLDVVDPEPLPPDSPLWEMPNVLITPHVAISGAPYRQKWEEILLENCWRFAKNEPLLNVVDKRKLVLREESMRLLPRRGLGACPGSRAGRRLRRGPASAAPAVLELVRRCGDAGAPRRPIGRLRAS